MQLHLDPLISFYVVKEVLLTSGHLRGRPTSFNFSVELVQVDHGALLQKGKEFLAKDKSDLLKVYELGLKNQGMIRTWPAEIWVKVDTLWFCVELLQQQNLEVQKLFIRLFTEYWSYHSRKNNREAENIMP